MGGSPAGLPIFTVRRWRGPWVCHAWGPWLQWEALTLAVGWGAGGTYYYSNSNVRPGLNIYDEPGTALYESIKSFHSPL